MEKSESKRTESMEKCEENGIVVKEGGNIIEILSTEEARKCLSNELGPKLKIELIRQCSQKSIPEILCEFHICQELLMEWINEFTSIGEAALTRKCKHNIKFMLRIVKVLILREGNKKGVERTLVKYGISKVVIRHWDRQISAVGLSKFLSKGVRGWKGKEFSREEIIKIFGEAEEAGIRKTTMKYDIANCTLEKWGNKLGKYGVEGLKERVGTGSGNGKHLYTPHEKVEEIVLLFAEWAKGYWKIVWVSYSWYICMET